jgi:replicative DNA helicase
MANSNRNEVLERLPPQSIDAEKSLLGSLMLDKDAIIKVADFLLPKDFYKKTHQNIYTAILELFEKDEPIDLLAVSNRLKDKNLLEEVGGNAYLTELINFVPTATHVVSYAKMVQKKRILRDLIHSSQEINSMGYDEEEDVDVLLDQAEQRIFSIAQGSLTQNFVPIKDTLEDAFERIDRLSKHGGSIRGVPTGFKHLDNILAGLQKSDLIILASRPSMGKSSLALNFATNIAVESKLPVGIFSLEMSRDQIVDRLISALSNVDLWKLRTGRLSQEGEDNDFARIQHAMGILAEAPIYVDDAASSNVLQMRAMARRLQAEHGLGLLIIDYLQLMEPRNPTFSTVQQVSEISRSLKGLSRELNVPVLAVSQLSRAVEHRTPQIPRLADLRESGSLEQDADVVLFIYREDRYREDTLRKNIADIIIAKHRNGPVGKVELYFDEQRASFRSLEKQFQDSDFRGTEETPGF